MPFNNKTSLFEFLKSEDSTNLNKQVERVLSFSLKYANDEFAVRKAQTNLQNFIPLLVADIAKLGNTEFQSGNNVVAGRVGNLNALLQDLIYRSSLPEDIKHQFHTTLYVRNEKEYYRHVALVTGAAIVFTFAPICFALAATGHALYATAAAMVGIGLALVSYSAIKNQATTTWYFDTRNGPKYNAKEFTQWVDNLDDLATETEAKITNGQVMLDLRPEF